MTVVELLQQKRVKVEERFTMVESRMVAAEEEATLLRTERAEVYRLMQEIDQAIKTLSTTD